MRLRTIEADGITATIRGRLRNTTPLESEYLVSLKQAHPDMKGATTEGASSSEALVDRNPRAWSLLGTASTFRYIAARVVTIALPGRETFNEPFAPDQLVQMFEHYRYTEELPDKSDFWSQVQSGIVQMDTPELPADPKVGGNAPTK